MSIFSYIWASGGTSRTIIVYPIEHSVDGTSAVNLTPKVKVYGSKVKFSTRSYGDEIWHGWSLRHPNHVNNIVVNLYIAPPLGVFLVRCYKEGQKDGGCWAGFGDGDRRPGGCEWQFKFTGRWFVHVLAEVHVQALYAVINCVVW